MGSDFGIRGQMLVQKFFNFPRQTKKNTYSKQIKNYNSSQSEAKIYSKPMISETKRNSLQKLTQSCQFMT